MGPQRLCVRFFFDVLFWQIVIIGGLNRIIFTNHFSAPTPYPDFTFAHSHKSDISAYLALCSSIK